MTVWVRVWVVVMLRVTLAGEECHPCDRVKLRV